MTDLAYAPGGVLAFGPDSPDAVAAHLAAIDVVSLSGPRLEAEVLASPGVYDTHPVRYEGGPVDRWQEETGRVQDGLQPDQWWQTTINYADMSYADAKKQARGELHTYLQAYRQSEFTAAGFVFLADAERSNTYNTLATFVDNDPTTVDYWIFDKDEVEHNFTSEAEMRDFIKKWRNLWFDAQTHTLAAWQTIRDALAQSQNGDFVRQTMANLTTTNPIPGMTAEETENLIAS